MNKIIKWSIPFVSIIGIATRLSADEGMWLLNKLPMESLQQAGLQLTAAEIFNPGNPSLTDAIVLLGGGTASFISHDGLILTNHHVAYSGLQALSSVTSDYLKNGFLAGSREEELATSYTAQIVIGIEDVTDKMFSVVNDTMKGDERDRAIRSRELEIEEILPDTAGTSHDIIEMYNGVKYCLFTFKKIQDIRLVYAPPSSIGNFGGEVDNWTWPRHTGDFALMRAYVGPDGNPAPYSKDNIPFHPRKFLTVSTAGYAEGSFAMIIGFPGRTYRFRDAASIETARDITMPATINLYKTRMDIIEQMGRDDRSIQIEYASRVRRLANTYKKYVGVLEGMHHANLIAQKRAEEVELAAFIASSPDRSEKYSTILTDLQEAADFYRTYELKSLLLSNIASGVEMVRVANRVRAFLSSMSKDSTGSILPPTEEQLTSVREYIATALAHVNTAIDKETLAQLILKSRQLPAGQQIAFFNEIRGTGSAAEEEENVRDFVDDLYEDTDLSSLESAQKLLSAHTRKASADPFVHFAQQLDAERADANMKSARYNRMLEPLRLAYTRVRLLWTKDRKDYPDANRTIRLTYGIVEGYSPRDAVVYDYETTLTGVIEKAAAQDPFVVPDKLKSLWMEKAYGPYADTSIHAMPVDFLTNNDITGGNSGSPVMNAKGELIGCAFDGNWEGVVGDYVFEEQYNRTISVDSRYILFVLDKFSGADNILRELVIH